MLLTTHYLEEAEELCDTIAIINHGKLIACDKKTNLMRSFDSKQLIVTPRAPLAAVPPALAPLAATLNAEGQLVISYRPSIDLIQDILQRIQEAGIVLYDVTTVQADLEDVFRHLTAETPA